MESQCTGYREAMKKKPNATQEELGNYPPKFVAPQEWNRVERKLRATCNITVQDAAWLWGVARIVWHPPVEPAIQRRVTESYINAQITTRRVEWLKRFGPHVAARLEAFIRRSLAAGKMDIPASQLAKVFEDLEEEAARKIEEHQNSIKWTGYDPATKGADKTAYQLVDGSGQVIKANVVGRLSDWVCLRLPEGEHWYLAQKGALLPATPQETRSLDAQWRAHTRLQQSKPDDRDLELPWV
jgi:hypothetical protein